MLHPHECIQKMSDELQIRGYRPNTVKRYTEIVTAFFDHTPGAIKDFEQEHVRNYFVYLKKDRKSAGATINQALAAIRFLYIDILDKPWDKKKLRGHRMPKRLPVAFSCDEVRTLLCATPSLKHRTILMTAYSGGLRVSEVTHLKVHDIDSKAMRILIQEGKGNKSRYVMLSEKLLPALRQYWKIYRPKDWLFPGAVAGKPIADASVQRAFRMSLKASGIKAQATFHSMRHSFATHLLENGTNISYIQELLGHKSIHSTLIYLKITSETAGGVKSPLDQLGLDAKDFAP